MSHPLLRLRAPSEGIDIKVEMGDGGPTPTAGFAGYETVLRVRRKAMTSFVGVQPFQMDVPILLDGFAQNRSVEPLLAKIERLGGGTIFTAEGPIYHSGDRFVFGEEPEWGEEVRAEDGTLIRLRLTLKLMEFVAATQAGRRKPKGKAGLAENVPLEYRTKDGDTLAKIAHRLYHDWKRWSEIGRKNGITDPHKPLRAGRTLKL